MKRILRKRPQQTRAKKTIDLVVDTAIDLLDEGKGDQVTTPKLARRAGVSVGSIYQYFSGKESIFRLIQCRLMGSDFNELREFLVQTKAETFAKRGPALMTLLMSHAKKERARRRFLYSYFPRAVLLSQRKKMETKLVEIALTHRPNFQSLEQEQDSLEFRLRFMARVLAETLISLIVDDSVDLDDPRYLREFLCLAMNYFGVVDTTGNSTQRGA